MADDAPINLGDANGASGSEGFTIEPDTASADVSGRASKLGGFRDYLRRTNDNRGSEPAKRRTKTRATTALEENEPLALGQEVKQDIAADVRDGVRLVSKTLVNGFGKQWELDATEVRLISNPATRLLKQSNVSSAATPRFTLMVLLGTVALVSLPRIIITSQLMKLAKERAAQPQKGVNPPINFQGMPPNPNAAHGFPTMNDIDKMFTE